MGFLRVMETKAEVFPSVSTYYYYYSVIYLYIQHHIFIPLIRSILYPWSLNLGVSRIYTTAFIYDVYTSSASIYIILPVIEEASAVLKSTRQVFCFSDRCITAPGELIYHWKHFCLW